MLLLLIHACLPSGVIRAQAQGGSNVELVQFPSAGAEFVAGPQLKAGAEAMAVWFDANARARGVVHGGSFPADPGGVDPNAYLNWNYYDQALCQYINYYRTGDARFLTLARKIADSWWKAPFIGEGRTPTENSQAPRGISLGGLMLRALDGRPEMWPWITAYTREMFHIWVGARTDYNGLHYGVRDGGYMLLHAANLAAAHPHGAVRAEFREKVLNAAVNYYARLQRPDGSWMWQEDWNFDGRHDPATDGIAEQPFHVGILLEGLVAVHRLTGDASVAASIVKAAENLYLNGFDRSPIQDRPGLRWNAMLYQRGTLHTTLRGAVGIDSNVIREARQLNSTVQHAFGYAYLLTNDPKFIEWGDEVFRASFKGLDTSYGLADFRAKEYSQNYRSAGRYLVWRSGAGAPGPTPPPAPTPSATPTPVTPAAREHLLGGRVFSGSAPMAGHRVIIYDAYGDAIGVTTTDALGRYSFAVNHGQRGLVRPANRGSFTPSEYSFTASGNRNDLDFVAAPNQTPGEAPIRLKATPVSGTQINLDWSDNSSPNSTFRLERCRGAGCMNFKAIAVFSSNLTSYGNAGLTAHTTYRYRVRATSGVGSSPYSNTVEVTTRP